MVINRVSAVVSLVPASALLGGCATTATPTQHAAEWDGLVRQPHPRLNAVFVRPGIQVECVRVMRTQATGESGLGC